MSWLGRIGASILLLLGSIFGASHQSQHVPVQNTLQPHEQGSPSTNPTVQQLMQQIGCSDAASCATVCNAEGMPPACLQLRSFMSASSNNQYPGNYSANSQSGNQQYNPGSNTAHSQNSFSYQGGQNPMSSGDIAFVGNNTPTSAAALPACSSNNAVFDHSPLNFSDFSGIEPMGHMNGEHILPNQADHVYLDALPSEASAEVYAPGNVTLLAVAQSVGIAGADKGANTVKLYFSPCKSLMFALQINSLSPQLQNALSGLQPMNIQAGATVQNTAYGNLNIKLTSGEPLGTVMNLGAGPGADFAAADVRTSPLPFIDQREATGMIADSYLHAVCPLDYFTSSLRSKLYSLLTISNAGANGVPACGTPMQDRAGTAQGNWYDQNLPTPSYQGINESALLAIAHYNLDPAQGIISVGTALIPSPILGSQLLFQPHNSGYVNREPSQITPDGHVYCFEGPVGAGGHGSEGHIDIRLDSATSLEADFASGLCANTPALSATSVTYQR